MEAMNGTFIKLYRDTLDNSLVMKDADHLAVWTWLLLKATWCESDCMFSGKRIPLHPGQLPPISRRTIASELHISESKVQRILKSFENEHQIEQRTDRQSRLITILNWDKYQVSEQRSEQRVNNERTTSEQRVNTIKEYKNKRNKEYIYSDVPEEIREPFMEWVAMRKKRNRPIDSKSAVTRALNKLNSLSKNPERQKELIEYAIYKNWLSFYPIPQEDIIPKPKVVEKEKPINSVPMPEGTREKMAALGFGNLIGKEK